jgi:hypothetical protein
MEGKVEVGWKEKEICLATSQLVALPRLRMPGLCDEKSFNKSSDLVSPSY